MKYELALKLKEAGYPQEYGVQVKKNNGKLAWIFSLKGQKIIARPTKQQHKRMLLDGVDVLVCPTLSELIEACGKRFDCLIRRHDGFWIAYGISGSDYNLSTEGSTPEEVVANLWLELNKK